MRRVFCIGVYRMTGCVFNWWLLSGVCSELKAWGHLKLLRNVISIAKYFLKFPSSLGSNLSPFLIKQPYVGYTTSYYKPPFLHRAILCSLIFAFDTQILGKRASRNKALNCIGYCWRVCRLQSAPYLSCILNRYTLLWRTCIWIQVDRPCLVGVLVGVLTVCAFLFLNDSRPGLTVARFLARPWWAGFLVAVVSPVSALPVTVGADCTWVCMEATVALSERTSSVRALRQFCKEAMAACWLDEVHDGHRKGSSESDRKLYRSLVTLAHQRWCQHLQTPSQNRASCAQPSSPSSTTGSVHMGQMCSRSCSDIIFQHTLHEAHIHFYFIRPRSSGATQHARILRSWVLYVLNFEPLRPPPPPPPPPPPHPPPLPTPPPGFLLPTFAPTS